jgi:hypothetical protein
MAQLKGGDPTLFWKRGFNIQPLKDFVYTDAQKLAAIQSIINATLRGVSNIPDANQLPTTLMDVTIDWSIGTQADDIYQLTIDGLTLVQDANEAPVSAAPTTGMTDQQMATFAAQALIVGLGTNTDLQHVQTNLTLPVTGLYSTTVGWSSSSTGTVSNSGVVSRPSGSDASIVFTATVTKNAANVTKTFNATVSHSTNTDAADVATDKAALSVGLGSNSDLNNVVSNLTLVLSGSHGTSISWGSSNTGAISNSGVVVKPSGSNASVTLTATISKGAASDTKEFNAIVLQNADTSNVATDKAALSVGLGSNPDLEDVTTNLTLSTSGSNGTSISWQSSSTGVVSNSGVVSRPSESNASVTLTATISKGAASDTKEFNLTVLFLVDTSAADVATDKAALSIGLGLNSGLSNVVGHLIFATSGSNGTTISWETNNVAVTSEGNIVRPPASGSDASVAITATISKGRYSDTKQFNVTVKKLVAVGAAFQPLNVNGGNILGGTRENASIYSLSVFGTKLVVGTDQGRISSYDSSNSTWTYYDASSGLRDNQTMFGAGILSCVYGSTIVFNDAYSNIASWDGTAWKKPDGSGTGTGIYAKLSDYVYPSGSGMATTPVVYNGSIVFASSAYVASWDGSAWKKYNGNGTGTGPYSMGTVVGNQIIQAMTVWNGFLIVAGGLGRIGSFDGTNWKNYDGTGTGTGPYSNGSWFPQNTGDAIYAVFSYGSQLLVGGPNDSVSSWDGSAWKYYDGTGTGSGIYHQSIFADRTSITKIVQLGSVLMFFGYNNIASYDGSAWKLSDGTGGGTGPHADAATGSDHILAYPKAVFFNSTIVYGGNAGRVNSWDGTKFGDQSGATGLYKAMSADFGTKQYPTYSIELLGDKLLVGSGAGALSYYDFTGSVWHPYTETSNPLTDNSDSNKTQEEIGLMLKYQSGSVILSPGMHGSSVICSYDGINWKTADGSGTGTGPYYTSPMFPYSTIGLYGNYIITGDMIGNIESWDLIASDWKHSDGSGSGNGPYASYFMNPIVQSMITSIVKYGDNLVVADMGGNITSWDGTNWKKYDGAGTGTGPYRAATGEAQLVVYDGMLVAGGNLLSSYDGSNWKNYDGTGAGTGIYSMGAPWNSEVITVLLVEGNTLVVVTESGKVASYDGSNWKNYDGTGTGTGPYNDGTMIGVSDNLPGEQLVQDAYAVDGGFYIVGGRERLASYKVSNKTWYNYDGTTTNQS